MLLFIAAPLASVPVQSLYLTAPVLETVSVETCTPDFTGRICASMTKTRPLIDGDGRIITTTEFVGLQSYRNVLETDRTLTFLRSGNPDEPQSIDFWKALRLTLTFTFITLPIMLATGMGIALGRKHGDSANSRSGDFRLSPTLRHHTGNQSTIDQMAPYRRWNPHRAHRMVACTRHSPVRPGLDH